MGIASGLIGGALIGGIIGACAPLAMALAAKNSGRPYDLTSVTSDENVLAKVDAWAQSNGYRLVRDADGTRVYQKGHNLLTSPMFLEVARDGSRYAFKSYVEINGWVLKAPLALSGDGFLVKVPRAMAKKAHNQLFAALGQPGLP